MDMEFDARCDDGNLACFAAMPLCYVLSANAVGNGDVAYDNNVLRLYDGNVLSTESLMVVAIAAHA